MHHLIVNHYKSHSGSVVTCLACREEITKFLTLPDRSAEQKELLIDLEAIERGTLGDISDASSEESFDCCGSKETNVSLLVYFGVLAFPYLFICTGIGKYFSTDKWRGRRHSTGVFGVIREHGPRQQRK